MRRERKWSPNDMLSSQINVLLPQNNTLPILSEQYGPGSLELQPTWEAYGSQLCLKPNVLSVEVSGPSIAHTRDEPDLHVNNNLERPHN